MKQKVKEKNIELVGKVTKVNSGAVCNVEIQNKDYTKHCIVAHLSGKIRKNRIRITEGDTVTVVMTQYDNDKGRICKRHS